ncbi:MFS transporter [Isoptericola sp. 178]|uniref:MFS transporter n=1 Tax=Isoptericola sp. 178 TaxID=3064651 RepID=UPI002713A457|nr:MFS transporter [Isoptericola sp. 178]MDO8143838.1 MFS transporter [Isoptericola sp. 178]
MATSSTDPSRRQKASAHPPGADPRRWKALLVLSALQFMILLDMTIVNVALPAIEDGMAFDPAGLTWVVNGYALAAGSLLILGGRLADYYGRRRLLIIGVVLFAASSALCGFATHPAMMILGRFGQGAAEAIAAPASLGLIALLFTDAKERSKALGIWGGLVALGGTLGYVFSGLLTSFTSWRWIFLINLPVALVALIAIPALLDESRMAPGRRGRLDVWGAATSTAGLVAIVYGLLEAAENPWGSAAVVFPVAAGIALLLGMLIIERRVPDPLLPRGFFDNRTRSVVNFTSLFFMAAFIGYTFMLTLFEQDVLGYTPLQSGLGYLPLGIGIGVGIGISSVLVPKIGVKPVVVAGFLGAGVGLALTSFATTDSSYLLGILPGMIVFAVFAGATMPAATNAALHNVTTQDSGLASGVQSTAQQIGGALGLAVLVTFAMRRFLADVTAGEPVEVAMTNGFTLGFQIGAVLMFVGGVLLAVFLERVDGALRDPVVEGVEADLAALSASDDEVGHRP